MFEKLTRTDLDRVRTTGSYPEYVEFLSSLRKGEGGRIGVEDAGVGRQTVKNRVKTSAVAAGVDIKFLRSSADTVVFEVVGKH